MLWGLFCSHMTGGAIDEALRKRLLAAQQDEVNATHASHRIARRTDHRHNAEMASISLGVAVLSFGMWAGSCERFSASMSETGRKRQERTLGRFGSELRLLCSNSASSIFPVHNHAGEMRQEGSRYVSEQAGLSQNRSDTRGRCDAARRCAAPGAHVGGR